MVVKCTDEAMLGSHYVSMHETEVEERNARFRYQNEPLVVFVQHHTDSSYPIQKPVSGKHMIKM